MGHPLIDEFARANTLHPEFLRRCQRVFKSEVQAQLDERDRLLEDNAALKAELEVLRAQSGTGGGRVRGAGKAPQAGREGHQEKDTVTP